ncbi:MAG: hypothetical protein RLZZ241_1559 [Bacteroidota bacterium]|jgi:hypothetical protein
MQVIINLHSYLAYVVLAVLIIAVLNALSGLAGKRMFTPERDFRLSLFSLILSHIQLLVGLILYFISPNGLKAIMALGMGGLNASARLLALEHPLINIIAVALITMGWSRHKKYIEGNLKFRSIAIFYGLGLLLLLSRIPWSLWLS